MSKFKCTRTSVTTSERFELDNVIMWHSRTFVNGIVVEESYTLSMDDRVSKRVCRDTFYSILSGDIFAGFDFYESLGE